MMEKISQNNTSFHSYLKALEGRIFKILPLLEKNNIGVEKYICSLLFELNGLSHVIEKIEKEHYYIILFATLEEIYSEVVSGDYDLSFLRSEILKSVAIVHKLRKGE